MYRDEDILIRGKGPPLMLLHGWPFHRATWRKVAPLLEPHFTCIGVNSFGMTEDWIPKDADLSFGGHVARNLELIERLGLGPVAILAHDTGATIARMMAAEAPQHVSSLVLLNTEIPHHRPPFIPLYQLLAETPGSYAAFKTLMKSAYFRRSLACYGGCFHDKRLINREFVDLFGRYWTSCPGRFNDMMRYLRGLDFHQIDQLDQVHQLIECPVHFIWGEFDPTFPVHLAEKMARKIPSLATFEKVPNTRFLPHEEAPERVAHLVIEDLQMMAAAAE